MLKEESRENNESAVMGWLLYRLCGRRAAKRRIEMSLSAIPAGLRSWQWRIISRREKR
jgi:hypothetical protein